ncbi:hypothetical protein ASG88_19850 [Nocardioides sp. Soil777]|uniref:hypothetical protein n=1 Tax=Nocardioides sp. Soil777 TaxID=1736409 RepID=UPI0007026526|nr:hypothetical protein [Nocardioides sp. Soil777]KRF06411.1 hypothetical protein ASG88_19850 [Nocardioides sp. Soil777]
MVIARRDLLRLGAAAAASVALSSCSGERPDSAAVPTRTPRPTPATPAVPTPVATGPAHLPPGSLYFGAALPYHRSLDAWERDLGTPLALNRSYFHPERNDSANLVRRCRDDLSRGRLPHVSTKAPTTWRRVADGEADDWLSGMFRPLGEAGGAVIFTLHHEPENDAGGPGMLPVDFVAMQRRAIEQAAGMAPEVTVVPVLQHWTFDPVRDDIDPATWLVPEASVMGLDIYNPWSPTNGKPWRSFGSKADEALAWLGDTPIAIGEYGCREDPDNPGLAAEWLRDAALFAREHNIVSMSYYNSDLNSPEGSWELRGSAEHAFADLLASDWVVRPA